jgi:endoglycosylceramidase
MVRTLTCPPGCRTALLLALLAACDSASSPRTSAPDGSPDVGHDAGADAGPPVSTVLHADGRYLRDAQGAVVLLRGLNVAGDSKVPPFRPIDDPKLLDPLPGWGVNVVRLLFTWEALEAERGVYDETYLRYYEGVLDALHARGIRAIVDVHQDAFSRFATDGCGEGMPKWALSPDVLPDEPDNGPDCKLWGFKGVTDEDTKRSWRDFYADTNGVRTDYLAMLELLATRFGAHPSVLGYDMLNEPFGDEVTELAPLYEDGARALRKHDPDAILFVSPQVLTSSGPDTKLPMLSFDNFVYAPHYYDGGVVFSDTWQGTSVKAPMDTMFNAAERLGAPLLLAEFGGPPHVTNIEDYVGAFYAECDARFVSATQWTFVAHWSEEKKDGWNMEDFSIVDANGKLRANFRVRPYAARIAGEPKTFVSTDGPSVELTWTHEPGLGATRLFAPQAALFDGQVYAETAGDLTCSYDSSLLHVSCRSASAGEKRVHLRPCQAGESCLAVAQR